MNQEDKINEEQEHMPDSSEMENAENTEAAAGGTSSDSRVQELQDKYLRLYADFENFRRRTQQEKQDLLNFGKRDLLLTILPVFDDMERALAALDKTDDKQALVEGVKLIYNKFNQALTQAGVQEIEAVGQPFDPELHEAITQVPAPAPDMKGKVIDQVQKGYVMKDKIIRYSKVVVAE